MGKLIVILIIILFFLIFLAILLLKNNRKLRKELKKAKDSFNIIQEKEKEYDKIKEKFVTGDDTSAVNATFDFLQHHKRGSPD